MLFLLCFSCTYFWSVVQDSVSGWHVVYWSTFTLLVSVLRHPCILLWFYSANLLQYSCVFIRLLPPSVLVYPCLWSIFMQSEGEVVNMSFILTWLITRLFYEYCFGSACLKIAKGELVVTCMVDVFFYYKFVWQDVWEYAPGYVETSLHLYAPLYFWKVSWIAIMSRRTLSSLVLFAYMGKKVIDRLLKVLTTIKPSISPLIVLTHSPYI